MEDQKIVVSACLAGIPCRYDGAARPDEEMMRLAKEKKAIPACPECMAGLKSPRPPAEIQGGSGADVLDGHAAVMNKEGIDITAEFLLGAEKFLAFVRANNAERVVLKSKSPSCGVSQIYDGTFGGSLIEGSGVTAALLLRNNIMTEER